MQGVDTRLFRYGQKELDYLSGADERLAAAIRHFGMLDRVVVPDLFIALLNAIVSQLISVKAASTIWGRMQDKLGDMTPQNIAAHPPEFIQSCGISMKKAISIRSIAEAVANGAFELDKLHELPDEEVMKQLVAWNGIGRWTAEMLMIHAMERPDIVSWGDFAIRKGMMRLYGLESLTKPEFEQFRSKYAPYGTVASIYLWEISSVPEWPCQ
ncbi:DNA-3-methyladenine glycosylase 2 family protein [Paenibacillus sp. HB172176]|uniref:DNA-3-methyladenine glycosylase family protein n=1 Tax=Paenibacillus sp. HB172176 TaxID=2493690 RepID=UPI001439B0A0|nr:DNA-3-methyladenine glycosylase 2 family protein [Paenibacillus sp. HB172176]